MKIKFTIETKERFYLKGTNKFSKISLVHLQEIIPKYMTIKKIEKSSFMSSGNKRTLFEIEGEAINDLETLEFNIIRDLSDLGIYVLDWDYTEITYTNEDVNPSKRKKNLDSSR